jgi:hypothetical protein
MRGGAMRSIDFLSLPVVAVAVAVVLFVRVGFELRGWVGATRTIRYS